MTRIDIGALVDEKLTDLESRSVVDCWAACGSIWSRLYVLASPGWVRWAEIASEMPNAFATAMLRSTSIGMHWEARELPVVLKVFDVEDDGSMEWNYAIDFLGVITPALDGRGVEVCVETALRVYLDAMFNGIARVYGDEVGRPMSRSEVIAVIAEDDAWARAVDFAQSLLPRSALIDRSYKRALGAVHGLRGMSPSTLPGRGGACAGNSLRLRLSLCTVGHRLNQAALDANISARSRISAKPDEKRYVCLSGVPDFIQWMIDAQQASEMGRYAAVINDSDSGFGDLRVVTNAEGAVPYFENMMISSVCLAKSS